MTALYVRLFGLIGYSYLSGLLTILIGERILGGSGSAFAFGIALIVFSLVLMAARWMQAPAEQKAAHVWQLSLIHI